MSETNNTTPVENKNEETEVKPVPHPNRAKADELLADNAFLQAVSLYTKDQELAEEALKKEDTPENTAELLDCLRKTAWASFKMGQTENAKSYYERARQLASKLMDQRASADDEWNLSLTSYRLAQINQSQGNLDEAVKLYSEASVGQAHLAEKNFASFGRFLSNTYKEIAQIYQVQGKEEEQLNFIKKNIEVLTRLSAMNHNAADLWDLASLYDKAAGLYLNQDDGKTAMAMYTESLSIKEYLEENRGSMQDHLNLAHAHYQLGMIYLTRFNHIKSSESHFREALNILEANPGAQGVPELIANIRSVLNKYFPKSAYRR